MSASPALSPSPAVSSSDTAPGTAAAPGTDATPAAGPSQAELLDFVRDVAADAELVVSLPLDPQSRTWVRLDGPAGSGVWLIGRPPGTGTGWHDHGNSLGAFMTASGELKENSLAVRMPTEGWKTLELNDGVDRERRPAAGEGRAFGRHHVHEVLNASPEQHAVSVHACHPPLPLMRRYSRTGPTLRPEQAESPEGWQ
ncbi:cysteine dioxygenase [Streptomyces sp. KMM 9044]|uniref:cysteine dioxygenase n=1 Tax=Streptomyces sp. KMM 9044 TaxID=2744474 RepID=UPI0021507B67|nr:cysteine dioxygenase [Streptomyces sp. KMM 9044]WAX77613.1 cysteine dioxygenase [Streptomyces sp. KMM 9044]